MATHMSDDGGQAVPLFLVFILLMGVGLLGLARLGAAVDDAARARTAADAAALAGAADGFDAAVELAVANGGLLHTYERHGGAVEVAVRVGDTVATARADIFVTWVDRGFVAAPRVDPDLSE